MRATRLAGAAIALVLLRTCASGVEIAGFPETTPASPMTVVVSWDTDLPGDSLVEYGVEGVYPHVVYDPALVTEHSVTVPLFETEIVYDFRVSSADGITEPAIGYDWYLNQPDLVTFQYPENGQTVTGEVRLKGCAAQPRVEVLSAAFEVVSNDTGLTVFVGVDNDGTDLIYGTEPAPEGDGWSAYWDTGVCAEGGYTARVTMNTAIGVYFGSRQVWLDHTPPVPEITSPPFGGRCYGVVPVTASGAQGANQVLFFEQQAPVIVSLPTVSFIQGQYNWPPEKPGKYMCHPCAQASILWTNPQVRNYYTNHPYNPNHSETVGRQLLVYNLADKKGTTAGGTSDDGAKSGSQLVLGNLKEKCPGFDWKYNEITGPIDMKKLKKAMTEPAGKVQGVGICIRGPNGWGHAMAVSKVDDNQKKDEKGNPYNEVTFTNPANGKSETYRVSPNGTLTYPASGPNQFTASMGSGFQMTGSPPPAGERASASDGWQPIGADLDPSDGWSVMWDTTAKPPGLYFLKAVATDPDGSAGEDMSEVALPAQSGFEAAKSQPDGMPADFTGLCSVTHADGSDWWIEDSDRAYGIGVIGGAEVSRDAVVTSIEGSMVTVDGERKIAAYGVTLSRAVQAVTPLGMSNRAIVGGDRSYDAATGAGQRGVEGFFGLNNVGLLVRTWGLIQTGALSSSGGFFFIDDGSGVILKCAAPEGVVLPLEGDYVGVTGISSCELVEGALVRVLRVRDQADIMPL